MATHQQRHVENTAAQASETAKQGARTFKEFISKFYRDWSLHLAQALAFSLITAIVPILILLLSIVGGIIGTLTNKSQQDLANSVAKLFPSFLSHDFVVSALNKLPSASVLLAVIAILASIFFGSRLFTLMEVCFDLAYRLKPRPQLKKNLVAIGMLFLFIVLIPILVFATTLPGLLVSLVQHTTFNPNPDALQQVVGILISLVVSFVLFELMYALIPNRRGKLSTKFRTSWMGALTAAVVLQLCLLFFPVYIRNFMNGYAGQVGFVLLLLAFFYLMALVLMIGAEVNAYFAQDIPPASADLITRASRNV